jgi:protein import protein ZIM17
VLSDIRHQQRGQWQLLSPHSETTNSPPTHGPCGRIPRRPVTQPQTAVLQQFTFIPHLSDHSLVDTMSLPSATRALQRVCLRQSSVTQSCRQQLRHLSSRPSSAFPPLLRIQSHLPTVSQSQQRRCESTARPKPLTDRPDELPKSEPREEVPSYEMTFTCKACSTRSSHRMSKQGYHHGTILITCPGCKNRHLIADHLKVCETDLLHLLRQLLTRPDLLRQAYHTRRYPRRKGSASQKGCSGLGERHGVLGRRYPKRARQEALIVFH